MTVIRPIDTDYGTLKGCHVDEMLQKHWGSTHTVKIFREPNKSLGISIVGGKVDLHSSEKSSDTLLGIFVKNVVPNSPAGKTGQFKTGDRILEVSGIDLRQASHETAVQAIRNASNPVTFVVQSLIPWKSTDTENNSVNNESNCPSPFPSPVSIAAPVDIKQIQFMSPEQITPIKIEIKQSKIEEPTEKSNQKPVPVMTIESSNSTKAIPRPKCQSTVSPLKQKHELELTKAPPLSPLIEKPDSEKQSILTPETSLKPKLEPELKKEDVPPISAVPSVSDVLPSSSEILSGDEKTEPEKVIPPREESLEASEEEDDEDIRELEGRTVSARGQQIDRASAANVRRSIDEIQADPEEEDEFGYTMNKVKKKYASLGHTILMVQLERSNQGLGLSLAGHKDRNCMAVFVCGLNPNGAAFKTGGIQIGDEILEVNGVVLHGRCHLNASAIIKGLSGPIFKVIILRRKTAIDDIAVKPITQFPISLAEEASEEQFSASYPNVRTIAIKKQGNQSLGIMIIEGKHAEVGQGIFISDIQEGSSAEKAGLEIGEMILAVNKDSLVGSNYDTAANLLKRTEGLVTLVVSNPGKKESVPCPLPTPTLTVNNAVVENNKNAISKPVTLKPVAPHSRPTTPVPEPVADPLTCPIVPGKDTTIEVVTDNKGLGIFFIGGKDTQINNGIVLVEIYPGGTVDKDRRLQPGDQILEVNGASLKDVTNTTATQALRQTLPKMKMSIYRPNNIEYSTIEVDLIKKPGKGLGLSVVARKSGKGVYIADIINGGTADLDGRVVKGDLLISVNGQNIENSTGEEAGAILKTVTGRVSLKLRRYKPTTR